MTASITVGRPTETELIVKFPFNRDFLDLEFKPSLHTRRWSKDRRAWIVDRGELRTVISVLEGNGYQVNVFDPDAKPQTSFKDAVTVVINAIEQPRRDRVIKVIAAAVHPDAGGTHEMFLTVNAMRSE